MFKDYTFSASSRFLKYVTIDTQSDPSSKTIPSTDKQKNLGRLLVEELLALGISDAHLDEFGYVYATLPGNSSKNVPVICFCSHMDTSPDCSGTDVQPQVHSNYQGGQIHYPAVPGLVLDPSEHPDLQHQIGNDIITSDGTTLLGADNKAGVAEIMDAIAFLVSHPEVKHGPIRILFTPDEEIGRGVDKVDMKKLGAYAGYTVDGESRGSMEVETFSADGLRVVFTGISAHPGFAKGKMVNAIKVASRFMDSLPQTSLTPETTHNREGFVHPVSMSGGVEQATVQFILRDFESTALTRYHDLLKSLATDAVKQFPGASVAFFPEEQYRNMAEILTQFPDVTRFAEQAIQRAGMQPKVGEIRGGTDGTRLSFMGLPCPNIFAGEHAFHSRLEWVSIQDMQKAVETLVYLAVIWEENAS